MVYTEIVTLKSRKGKVLESVRDAFKDEEVASGATVVRNMSGLVIIYNFSTMTAEFWRPGSMNNRRKANIINKRLDN